MVNLGPARAYLPPGPRNRWFLSISDMAEGDSGVVQEFMINCNGATYRSPDPPVTILDGRTCCAYIPRRSPGAITGWLLPLLLD
ncbi:hypothetical protein DSCA_15670 [Desulfosarcina alkanivorans]|uniref:Uncharacterized protein n=1 Tax=Desulfosarcina alkanivorans TaxID=571177 RepID=A0A5K7YSL4_9BACT|nr:hypothetical protein [Desulfosarcina alkanivorans]BBO67637.1 hypothetical protein DSCA_15670 [Desulfosarcina alkanivorans]